MEDQNTEGMIDACCYSEKANVSIGFGFTLDGENAEIRRQNATDSINEGAADSFWENYEEFEPGIGKAKKLVDDGLFPSLREALSEVFGHFQFRFEIDGAEIDLDHDVDPDELMFDLMENK